LSEKALATYAVFPFGVIAMATGRNPTLIALSAVLVAVRIGVTQCPYVAASTT
jgi:hypothetical protein